ncbi:hypothetical protein Scep_023660 [Stephania cephalantha]|uniref:Uncharacterized protein n=1 Tax=Stephania cephalantha TaxID=152367 RepID=A0AAP0HXQ0_9MAGN
MTLTSVQESPGWGWSPAPREESRVVEGHHQRRWLLEPQGGRVGGGEAERGLFRLGLPKQLLAIYFVGGFTANVGIYNPLTAKLWGIKLGI